MQRHDLFGAVVCAVPLLDMVRYHLFGSGKTWISEYGSVEQSEEMFRAAVGNVKLALAGKKKLGNFSEYGFGISPPDGVPYCYCAACKETSQGFRYPRYAHRTFQSEEFFSFAAKLANCMACDFYRSVYRPRRRDRRNGGFRTLAESLDDSADR